MFYRFKMHSKVLLRFYTVTLNPQLTCQHIAEIQLQFYPLHAFFLFVFFTQICDTRNTHVFCLILPLFRVVLQYSVWFPAPTWAIYFQNYAHCSSIKWTTAHKERNSFGLYYPFPLAEYFIKHFLNMFLFPDTEMLTTYRE